MSSKYICLVSASNKHLEKNTFFNISARMARKIIIIIVLFIISALRQTYYFMSEHLFNDKLKCKYNYFYPVCCAK